VAALSFLTLSGLNTIVMQETAKGNHGAYARVLKHRLRGSALNAIALLALSCYYLFVAKQISIGISLVVVSCFFPVSSALDCYQAYLLGRRDYALYSRLPVIIGIAIACITAIMAWLAHDPSVVLLGTGVTQIILYAMASKWVLRIHPPQNSECSDSAVRFGVGMSVLGVLTQISAQLDTILVGTLLSMPEVAVLSLATLPLEKSKVVLTALGEFFGPKIMSQSGRRLFHVTEQVMLLYALVILCYIPLLVMIIPIVFRVFFPSYTDAIPLAYLGVLCLLPSAPANIMEMSLYSQERMKQFTLIRVVQFGFDIIIGVSAITLWGVSGAILARFLAGLFRTGLTGIFYMRNRRQMIAAEAQGTIAAGSVSNFV